MDTKAAKNSYLLILLLALGAQTLIVELTIPRMIAPVFGNTLFCWTAIIAVVLIALTLGYHLGGKWSNRLSSTRAVTIIAASSAAWVVGLALLGSKVVGNLTFLDLMFGPLVATLLLAAVPAFLDAIIVPLVIELRTENRGEAAGKCFAWSTVGSIIGVLATGYLLLPLLGIKGALLTGASLVFLSIGLVRYRLLSIAGVATTLAVYLLYQPGSDYLYEKSNGYHHLRVTQQQTDPPRRGLLLDTGFQGAVLVGTTEPATEYHRVLSGLYDQLPAFNRVIQFGGGTFSIPSELVELYPGIQAEVAEIDPDVIDVGYKYMGLKEEVIVHEGDARQVLKAQEGQYDLIINDAFKGLRNMPYHMTTLEFVHEVDDYLAPEGVYVLNVRGTAEDSHVTGSIIKTVKEVFEFVRVVPVTGGNTWVLASHVDTGIGDIALTSPNFGMVLTDNHAPIEFLIIRDLVHLKLEQYFSS